MNRIARRIAWARWGTLLAHQGLLAWLLIWHAWLVPSPHFPIALVLAVLLLPLLLPLRGLLHGRAYTHAWTTFLALFYFVYAVGASFGPPEDRFYGRVAVALSCALFLCAALYARWAGREAKVGASVFGRDGTKPP